MLDKELFGAADLGDVRVVQLQCGGSPRLVLLVAVDCARPALALRRRELRRHQMIECGETLLKRRDLLSPEIDSAAKSRREFDQSVDGGRGRRIERGQVGRRVEREANTIEQGRNGRPLAGLVDQDGLGEVAECLGEGWVQVGPDRSAASGGSSRRRQRALTGGLLHPAPGLPPASFLSTCKKTTDRPRAERTVQAQPDHGAGRATLAASRSSV